jgi:hypothetical protein
MRALESQENTDTALTEIAYLSARNPAQVFHSLMHHINEGSLRRCFDKLDGKKALGIDRVSKAEYTISCSEQKYRYANGVILSLLP